MYHRIAACAPSLALIGVALPTLADDRAPTDAERTAIEAGLKAAGFVSWEEIEFDDGLWEVDDVRKQGSTQEWDVKLDPATYAIVSERQDD